MRPTYGSTKSTGSKRLPQKAKGGLKASGAKKMPAKNRGRSIPTPVGKKTGRKKG